MVLPVWLLVLLPAIVYIVVNSLLVALQLCHFYKIKRLRSFLSDAFGATALSIVGVFFFVALYSRNFFCLRTLTLNATNLVATGCPTVNVFELMLHATVPMLVIFGLVKIFIQFFMLGHTHTIADGVLIRMLVVSNTVATLVHYGILQVLM
jgi:hypothetical protein